MNNNIQNELLEISKDISEELLNSFMENLLNELHSQTEHQREALFAVMMNSPLLKEFIFSSLFDRTFLKTENNNELNFEKDLECVQKYILFLHTFHRTIEFPVSLLINLITILFKKKELDLDMVYLSIYPVVDNKEIFLQSFADVSDCIQIILPMDNDDSLTRGLYILGRTMPSVVQKNEKIREILTKLFEKIADFKKRGNIDKSLRCMVIRRYFQAEYNLHYIPYDLEFFSYIDESCPKYRTFNPKKLIIIVTQEIVDRVEIGNDSNEIVKFAAWVGCLAPIVGNKSIFEKFFNYFNSVRTYQNHWFLWKNSQKTISSYLMANNYWNNKEEIAEKCLTDYEGVALFLISAIYDGEQIPLRLLEKIFRVDYDFNNQFEWFSDEVARQFRTNISNDEIVKLFVPFLDFNERQCKVIEVLDQIDHTGLSSLKVYKILFGLMNLFVDEVSRIDSHELRREKYGFLFVLAGITNSRHMFNIPYYFARQAKFGNKNIILELLVKGYCNELSRDVSEQSLNGLRMFTGADIPEFLKWKVRSKWLQKNSTDEDDQKRVARQMRDLIKLNIFTDEDLITLTNVYLPLNPSVGWDYYEKFAQGFITEKIHDSGYRFISSKANEGASIISIEELSEIN